MTTKKIKSVNCCTPYCCNHDTSKVQAKRETTDYLTETYTREMNQQINGASLDKISKPKLQDGQEFPISRSALSLHGEDISQEYFPITRSLDRLGLSPRMRKTLVDDWNSLDKVSFISLFMQNVFEMKKCRKPFFIPEDIPTKNGQTLVELPIFKRHVFLQRLSYQALIDVIDADKRIASLAQEIGLRHLKFRKVVVFEDWMFQHMIDCFDRAYATINEQKDTGFDEKRRAWKRVISWFYSHVQNYYHQANNK